MREPDRQRHVDRDRRVALARRAATARWIRDRFGSSSFEDLGLPGADLVDQGLVDLCNSQVTIASLLVSLAAPRLRREGIPVGEGLAHPEDRLYDLLLDRDGDLAHHRYNAYLDQMSSFCDACAGARRRARKTAS